MELSNAIGALAALAQETRIGVFRLLVQAGPTGLAAGDIAEQLGVAPATLSFHLRELTRAGLVRPQRRGRSIVYKADFAQMRALVGYLMENCCAMGAEDVAAICAVDAPGYGETAEA